MLSNKKGYRGYIVSRPVDDHRVPQHIQNVVIREYAEKREMQYLLSVTEYSMSGSYLILEQALDELSGIEGIILYSMFALPALPAQRLSIYRRVLDAGCSLHAAVERFALRGEEDIERWENVLITAALCGDVNYKQIEEWLT
ncbi:sporadic carbohydrate cluster protein, LIC12192 family [Rhodospirillales bacterium URHD0017]|nr:sporadic carbohydrate cluster protein, LIC12192 family [Rhodospirillales bacterium URHD0017]